MKLLQGTQENYIKIRKWNKQLENQESLGNVLEQKWENNMLEKHTKIKSKKAKRLKNENFLKKNETLKASSGIETKSFWKSKIWFQFQFSINLVSRPQF